MREEDLADLRREFDAVELADWEDAILRRLGAQLPRVDALAQALLADLDPVNFGVSWWGGPSVRRRILVADQLVICTRSITINMRDARLHHLEAIDGWELFAERFVATHPGPHPELVLPQPKAPIDGLPHIQAEIHVAGFFRAVGSAVDCLAATLIGVAALPLRILRADMLGVMSLLRSGRNLAPEQLALGKWLDDLIARVGPEGWFEWALDMRNMLVHRGRRMESVAIDVVAPGLIVRDLRRSRTRHLLPLDPGRQEIEVLRDSGGPYGYVLHEHADATLGGVYRSVSDLCEQTSDYLLDMWARRKAAPELLPQPLADQWPDSTPGRSTGFAGYRPETLVVPRGGKLGLNPKDARRFEAGALLDADRPRWQHMT